ncbi:acyltransferase [Lactobacillus sp.]|uniref:acyltransferase n=1 Tax=Lactobacillus sp. TaxID=1591 RepID=UPI003EF8B346
MQKQRIWYLDYLRIIAILGVITIHVSTSLNFYQQDYQGLNWQLLNLFDGVSRISVPLFIMISGALFLDPAFDLTLKKLFKKYLAKIAVVYGFWQVFYCSWAYYSKGYDLLTVVKYLVASYDHLWYLPMIAGLYLVTPFLRKIVRNRQLLEYYLLLALIFASVLPTLLDLLNNYPFPIKHLKDLSQSLMRFLGKMNVKLVMGYSGYYVAGYYFSRAHLTKKHLYLVQVLGVIGATVTAVLSGYLTVLTGKLKLDFYSYTSFFTLLAATAVFLTLSQLKPLPRWEGPLKEVSQSVLGIYLLHPLVLFYLSKTSLWTVTLKWSWLLPAAVLTVFFLTLALVYLLRKSSFLRRYLL